LSSEPEPTPVDDILADAAERAADRKKDRITTPDDFTQFSEFDGIIDLDLNVRIPKIRIAQETGVYGSRTRNGTTNVNDTNYPDCPRVSMDQLIKGGLNGSREMCTIRPPNMLDSPNIANFTMP
jgi:hypothetical protein